MFHRFIFIFVLSGMLLRAQGESSGLSIEQARVCLETTQPNPMESINVMLLAADPTHRTKEFVQQAKIYQKQMAAINVLIASKTAYNLSYLIPFLGYVENAVDLMGGDTHQKSLDDVKSEYPVFAAMLNTPGSAQILESYCLDTRNPDNYRILAFSALKLVDIQTFKSMSGKFNEQWHQSNSKIKEYIDSLESGPYSFGGEVDVKATVPNH